MNNPNRSKSWKTRLEAWFWVGILLLSAPGRVAAGARGDWWMFQHDPQHTGRSSFVGPSTPSIEWTFAPGGQTHAAPAIGADGTIYIGWGYDLGGYNVYAVDPTNGRAKSNWTFSPGMESFGPAIGADGTIYIVSKDGFLYALDGGTGRQKWSFLGYDEAVGQSGPSSNPVIGSDGTIYVPMFDATAHPRLFALRDAGTNYAQKWESSVGALPGQAPALAPDGTIYFLGDFPGEGVAVVHALHPDGTEDWRFPTTGNGVTDFTGFSVGSDGTLYVGASDDNLYALDGASGRQKWAFPTGGAVRSAPAIGADGTVYFGSDDHYVYAVDGATGARKWKFDAGDLVKSSLAVGGDGTVYAGTGGSEYNPGNFYALDGATGQRKWVVKIGSGVVASAIGADGTIYVVGAGGALYAVGAGGGTNPSGPGPNLTWQARQVSGVGDWRYLAYGNGTFVGVSSAPTVFASTNGVDWASDANFPQNAQNIYYGVRFAGGRFLVTGTAPSRWVGGNPKIWSFSNDHWLASDLGGSRMTDTAYGNGVFVAAGPGAGWKPLLVSTDATNWRAGSIITNIDSWPSYGFNAAAFGKNEFVAVGTEHNGGWGYPRIAASVDGTNWLVQAIGDFIGPWGDLYDVTFGAGQFVAVGYGGPTPSQVSVGGRILTSTNGVDWTCQLVSDSTLLASVAYGAGWFVAVGHDGVILTSSDGRDWSPEHSPTTNHLYGVTFANQRFYAVGDNGVVVISSSLAAAAAGDLQVTISPSDAVAAGAQWQVDGGVWQNSGATVSALSAGQHTVRFMTINGWTPPADQTATVVAGQTATVAASYTPNSAQTATISVTASPMDGGTVAGAGTFPVGSSQTVTATANSGYLFVNWTESGSAVSASPTYTFTLNADRTLRANFAASSPPQSGAVVAWGDNQHGQGTVPADLAGVVAIAAGSDHSLVVKSDGAAVAWGDDTYGQTAVPAGLQASAVAAQGWHSLALKSDGAVAAWGDNFYGESAVPSGLGAVTKIAAGAYHSLAVKSDGTVAAWGDNSHGQCAVPSGLGGVIAIAGGTYHSLAVKADGTVVAWGDNAYGQCSIPPNLTGVTAVAAGDWHSLALKSDGAVAAWGNNTYGQCAVPPGLTGVIAIAAGSSHSVALKSDGTVAAWGDNRDGQCAVPSSLNGVVAIAAGGSHTLALAGSATPHGTIALVANPANGGSVTGAGSYPVGWQQQISATANAGWTFSGWDDGSAQNPRAVTVAAGTTTYTANFTQQPVQGTITVAANPSNGGAVSGGGTFPLGGSQTVTATANAGYKFVNWTQNGAVVSVSPTYAFTLGASVTLTANFISISPAQSGTVAAWGNNDHGQSHVPSGLSGVIAIAAGGDHSLALKSDGTVVAWGNNDSGQSTVPPSLSGVIAISAAQGQSLALKSDGTMAAWGKNDHGQCAVPAGLGGVIAIAAGGDHSLALKSDGTVVAWGDNSAGQSAVPPGLSGVVGIAASEVYSLALRSDGSIAAWGGDTFNQISGADGLSGITRLAAGQFHCLGLKSDGTVAAWGDDLFGESTVPSGLNGVVAIAAGDFHSLALKSDGTVVGWGANDNGESAIPSGLSGVIAIAASGSQSLALVGAAGPETVRLVQMSFANHSFSLSVGTSTGRNYFMEYKNSLSDANWTVAHTAPGNGAMMKFSDDTATSAARFYRIRAQ